MKALKVSGTLWESMGSVSTWLNINRISIVAYLGKKNPACAPSYEWWIIIVVLSEHSSRATEIF